LKTIKYIFGWRVLLGVWTLFAIKWLLSLLPIQIDFLNVFEDVFESFRLSDFYYSYMRSPVEQYDERIVVVNISNLSRGGIAKQLEIINKYEPKVVGLDIFFTKPKDSLQDLALSEAMRKTDHLVLGVQMVGDTLDVFKDVVKSMPLFAQYAHDAHVNTISESDDDALFRSWRETTFVEHTLDSQRVESFAAKITSFYDSAAYKRAMDRNNEFEEIYYSGNQNVYRVIDTATLFNERFDPSWIKGKIVLLGYTGGLFKRSEWDDDKFFTPLNPHLIGRSEQDMYGVIVHANIITMILDDLYIYQLPEWIEWCLAVFFGLINMALFLYLYKSSRWTIWYDAITKPLQIVQAVLLMYISVYLFGNYRCDIEFAQTIFIVLLCGDLTQIYNNFVLKRIEKRLRRSQTAADDADTKNSISP